MYTERDRPFLLRRPLQTSLNTTFSPAFRRRDYPLRIFNHTLWGGFDCLFRVREVKEHSLKAAIISSIRVLWPGRVYKQGLGGVGRQECCPGHGWPGTAVTGRVCNPDRPLPGGGGGLCLWSNFYETLWNSSPFPGKKKLYVGLFLHSKAKSRLG